uniref:Major facilitator superfamily (MFS) profile domain-containing protein n=1 Tax=Ditylenchus dipsaci TaxID=166011 RepID=A0A915ERB3_9BILA
MAVSGSSKYLHINEPSRKWSSCCKNKVLLLIIVVLCLTINWANILAFNFTVSNGSCGSWRFTSQHSCCDYDQLLGFNWFLAVRFLQGVAFAGDMATFGHFISYWTYKKQYAFFTATLCTYVELAPVFTNPVAGLFCDSSFGWPGVYYFHSITTIVLFSLFFLGRDTEDENAKRNVPYKQILTSPAAWAFTPTYLNKVQNFEVLETGLLGAVPPLLQDL